MSQPFTSSQIQAARRLILRSRRALFGTAGIVARGALRGQGLTFEEVRPYLPGDEVRAIDWKVTARMGRPFIKSFREEKQQTVWILVDDGKRMNFGSSGKAKREVAIEVAGLLALVATMQKDRVGLCCYGERSLCLPPRPSRRQAELIAAHLLGTEHRGGNLTLGEAVQRLQRHIKSRTLIFVLSDGLSDSPVADLRPLCRHHEITYLQLTDPWEIELPRIGPARFTDISTGQAVVVDTSSERFRRIYTAQAAQRSRALRQELANLQISWIPLQIDRPPIEALQRHFTRKRSRTG